MAFPGGGLIPQPYHHMMLINAPRMASFRFAIDQVVKPGMTVLEAGAGTGVLSALAARAGAGHVYAIELDPDLAAVARRTAALNGLAERITVVEGRAEDFVPPTPVDVVICEMLHVGLVNEQQVGVMRAVMGALAARQDVSKVAVIPCAAVSAVQLMAVDYRYVELEIPLVRSNNPYVEDPRLTPLSEPVPYWVCDLACPQTRVDVTVSLVAAQAGRVNAIQLITKAVMTRALDHPLNDWYLFQLQLPMPPRDVVAGETLALRLAYDAGCPIEAMTLAWA